MIKTGVEKRLQAFKKYLRIIKGNTVRETFSFFLQAGVSKNISQMPVILVPLHFDRDPTSYAPSCQRSVVIRTFITNDFMTGIPAEPGKQLPLSVR